MTEIKHSLFDRLSCCEDKLDLNEIRTVNSQ